MINHMIATFDPNFSVLKLGKHTAEFAASVSKNAKKTIELPTILELRAAVATTLKDEELTYPYGMAAKSYSKEIIGGMDCYLLRTNDSESVPTLIMFYGGGFCLNTMNAHKAFMANVAAPMSCNIILPDCPLAPENKAPEIIAQSEAFLKEFLKNPTGLGVSKNIVLMGWSSGSNLALTLSLNLQRTAPQLFKKVSQLILLSPWMDLSMCVSREGPYQSQQNMDTIAAGPDLLEMMGKCYLPKGFKGHEPEFCPVARHPDEMRNLPPVTVIIGGCEILFGDGVFTVDTLKRAGVPVQLVVLEGQTHNCVVFHQLSLDGVYVPDLVAHVVRGKAIDDMVGQDGLGLIIRKFNM